VTSPPCAVWLVDSRGVATGVSQEDWRRFIGVSPEVSAAFDLLTDDGMDPKDSIGLMLAAETQGRDPEAAARHILKLRRALKGLRSEK
jgi:hypothetical protein